MNNTDITIAPAEFIAHNPTLCVRDMFLGDKEVGSLSTKYTKSTGYGIEARGAIISYEILLWDGPAFHTFDVDNYASAEAAYEAALVFTREHTQGDHQDSCVNVRP